MSKLKSAVDKIAEKYLAPTNTAAEPYKAPNYNGQYATEAIQKSDKMKTVDKIADKYLNTQPVVAKTPVSLTQNRYASNNTSVGVPMGYFYDEAYEAEKAKNGGPTTTDIYVDPISPQDYNKPITPADVVVPATSDESAQPTYSFAPTQGAKRRAGVMTTTVQPTGAERRGYAVPQTKAAGNGEAAFATVGNTPAEKQAYADAFIKATLDPVTKAVKEDQYYQGDNFTYTFDNLIPNYDRVKTIANKPYWTEADKAEAKSILDAYESGFKNVNPFSKERFTKFEQFDDNWAWLLNVLETRTQNAGQSFVQGMSMNVGLPFAEAIGKLYNNPDYDKAINDLNKLNAYSYQTHSNAYSAGNVAGEIGKYAFLSQIIGTPGAPSTPVQSIVNGGLVRGANAGINNTLNAISGKKTVGNALIDTGIEFLSGAAGGAASLGTNVVGVNILSKLGLSNNFVANTVLAGIGGSVYQVGSSGFKQLARQLGYKDGQNLTAETLIKDAIVGGAFAAINFGINNYQNFTTNGATDNSKEYAEKWFKDAKNPEDVKRMWRQYAKMYHPDNGGDEEIYKEVSLAYEYILNATKQSAAQAYTNATTNPSPENTADFTEKANALVGLLEDFNTAEINDAVQIINDAVKGINATSTSVPEVKATPEVKLVAPQNAPSQEIANVPQQNAVSKASIPENVPHNTQEKLYNELVDAFVNNSDNVETLIEQINDDGVVNNALLEAQNIIDSASKTKLYNDLTNALANNADNAEQLWDSADYDTQMRALRAAQQILDTRREQEAYQRMQQSKATQAEGVNNGKSESNSGRSGRDVLLSSGRQGGRVQEATGTTQAEWGVGKEIPRNIKEIREASRELDAQEVIPYAEPGQKVYVSDVDSPEGAELRTHLKENGVDDFTVWYGNNAGVKASENGVVANRRAFVTESGAIGVQGNNRSITITQGVNHELVERYNGFDDYTRKKRARTQLLKVLDITPEGLVDYLVETYQSYGQDMAELVADLGGRINQIRTLSNKNPNDIQLKEAADALDYFADEIQNTINDEIGGVLFIGKKNAAESKPNNALAKPEVKTEPAKPLKNPNADIDGKDIVKDKSGKEGYEFATELTDWDTRRVKKSKDARSLTKPSQDNNLVVKSNSQTTKGEIEDGQTKPVNGETQFGFIKSNDSQVQRSTETRRSVHSGRHTKLSGIKTSNKTKGQIQLAVGALGDLEKVATDGYRVKNLGLAYSLTNEFLEKDNVDICGQTVNSARDLATIAQIYRDPRFETLRYFFTDKNNKVIWQTAISSSLPTVSSVYDTSMDMDDWVSDLCFKAKKNGATGVWMLHNHPNGKTIPSGYDADLGVTELLSNMFDDKGLSFLGHVIIDHDEYSEIHAEKNNSGKYVVTNNYSTHKNQFAEDTLKYVNVPSIDNGLLGLDLRETLTLAKASKLLERSTDQSVIIYMDSNGKIIAVQECSNEYLLHGNLSNHSLDMARSYGGEWAGIVTNDKQTFEFLNRDKKLNGIAQLVLLDANDGRIARNTYEENDTSYSTSSSLQMISGKRKGTEDMVLYSPNNKKGYRKNGKGNTILFSSELSPDAPVTYNDKLVAIHNMNEEALLESIRLGGLAMPSFAVVSAENGHSKFGDISVIASRDSIDPKNKKTAIYTGDAWTPSFPEVNYKVNYDGLQEVRKHLDDLFSEEDWYKKDPYLKITLDTSNTADKLKSSNGTFADAYKDNMLLKAAYLKEHGGIDIPIRQKGVVLGRHEYDNDFLNKLVESIDVKEAMNSDSSQKVEKYGKPIRKLQHEWALNKYSNPKIADGLFPLDGEIYFSEVDSILYDAYKYLNEPTVVDTKALEKIFEKRFDDASKKNYELWLSDLGGNVVEKKGIRNTKDVFTPTGSRRSFDALHYDYSLANIVKAMKSQSKQGQTGFLGGSGAIRGAALNEYNSIDAVKADKERLTVDEEKYAESYDNFSELTREVASRINDDIFDSADIIAEALKKSSTQQGIANYLRRELVGKGYIAYKVTEENVDSIAKDILKIKDVANKLPVKYFEAKLYRAFPIDEALAYVIPDDSSQKLKNYLRNSKVEYVEYKAGDEEDRTEKIRNINGALFSTELGSSKESDKKYLDAVKSNDMETAQKMVKDYAKSKGYTVKALHGTSKFGFTQIDTSKSDDNISFFATDSEETANSYSYNAGSRSIGEKVDLSKLEDKFVKSASSYHKALKTFAENYEKIAGKKPWKDSIDFTEEVRLLYDDKDISLIQEDMYDYIEDCLYNAFATTTENVEDADYDKFIESEPVQALYEDVDEIIKTAFAYRSAYNDYWGNKGNNGNYELYVNTDKMLELDAKGKGWRQIPLGEYEDLFDIWTQGYYQRELGYYNLHNGKLLANTRDVAMFARSLGARGAIIKNVIDDGGNGKKVNSPATVYIFLDPQRQVKSADTVTYDDNGNIIPLSERFNPKNDDIRFSREWTFDKADDLAENYRKLSALSAAQEDKIAVLSKALSGIDYKPDTSTIRKIAKSLRETVPTTTIKQGEVETRLSKLYETIRNSTDGSEVYNLEKSLAEDIIYNGGMGYDADEVKRWNEFKDKLKAIKLKPTEELIAEVGEQEDFNHFRRQSWPTLIISKDGDSMSKVYRTLNEWDSSEFPEGLSDLDAFNLLREKLTDLKPKTLIQKSGTQSAAEYVEDMIDTINDAYFSTRFTPGALATAEKSLQKQYKEATDAYKAEIRQQLREKYKASSDAYKAELKRKDDARLEKRKAREDRYELMQDILKRGRKLARMKGDAKFRADVDKLIGDIDLVAPGIRNDTRQKLEDKKKEVYEQAAKDPDYARLHKADYDELFSRLEKKHLSEFTIDELNELSQALIALEHSKRTYDREIKEDRARLFSDMGRMAVEQQRIVEESNFRKQWIPALQKYKLWMLNPTRAAKMIDGYDPNGVITYMVNQLNDGQTKQAQFKMEAEKMFEDINNDKELIKDFADPTIDIGNGVKISKGMRISLYLHSKNRSNRLHIASGGIKIPDAKYYAEGKYQLAYARGKRVKLTPTQVDNIVPKMTEGEKRYADIAYKFFNETCKKAINETSMLLDGYEKAIVENYFPIRTDPNFTQTEIEGLLRDATIEGLPMLKERLLNASNPILLEDVSQVVLRQENNTAKYYGLAIPVRNWNKFWNYTSKQYKKSIKEAVSNAWPELGKEYLEQMVTDLQTSRKADRDILDKAKSLYAGSVLNLNLGVAIKQSASYPFAASVIGWQPLVKASGKVFKQADYDYMDSITPWGYMRRVGMSGTPTGEVAQQRTNIENASWYQKLKQKTDWIRAVDVKTTDTLFFATEEYVKEKYPNLEVRGEAYNKKVGEIYNEVLQRTQPSYDVMQRNEFLKSTGLLARVAGMFKTQTFNMGGEIMDAYFEWDAMRKRAKTDENYKGFESKAKEHFGKTIAATIVSQAMLAGFTALANMVMHKMKPYRDDETGEITKESFFGKLWEDFIRSFAGMTLGGSELQDAILFFTHKEKWYGLSFPGLDTINDVVESTGKWSSALTSAIEDNKIENIKKLSTETAKLIINAFQLRGVPSNNLYNMANAINLWVQDAINGEFGTFNAGKGILGVTDTSVSGEQYAQQVVKALQKGDDEKAISRLSGINSSQLIKAIGAEADLDEDGEVIEGSKKQNAIAMIKSYKCSDEVKGKIYAHAFPSDKLNEWVKNGGSEYQYMNLVQEGVEDSAWLDDWMDAKADINDFADTLKSIKQIKETYKNPEDADSKTKKQNKENKLKEVVTYITKNATTEAEALVMWKMSGYEESSFKDHFKNKFKKTSALPLALPKTKQTSNQALGLKMV